MRGKFPFRSLTRFAIGSVLNGMAAFTDRLSSIETRLQESNLIEGQPVSSSSSSTDGKSQEVWIPTESESDWIGYAMLGMLVHAQSRLEKTAGLADHATRVFGDWGDFVGGPLYRSRWMRPVRNRFKQLEQHGVNIVDGWIAAGRNEAYQSQQLARLVVNQQVDNAIEFLASNQEVQSLVQSQSAGLVDEVVEEARERTVSADYFLEGIIRTIFGRPPRSELPEPPEKIKNKAAEHTIQLHGRSLSKLSD